MTGLGLAPVSAIADVLALWGEDGWLTPPLLPVVGASAPVGGRALTLAITVAPSGPGLVPIYDVLSSDLSDRVLVIAGATRVPGAIWGEILTRAALQQQAEAVLVEGWVRDRPEMSALGLPVYACGQHVVGPCGQAHLADGSIGAGVVIERSPLGPGVEIADGDLVVTDATGCVRVRAAIAGEVVEAARRYAAAEDLVARAIDDGEPVANAYRHKKSIVDELRR